MSGIVLELRCDGARATRSAVARMLDRLAHRGPDGRHLVVNDRAALGCQHFLTTPEESGERQPLADGGLLVALDGRLDNREELQHSLGLELRAVPRVSDAALVLAAFKGWGVACFERFLGPFAIVVWDGPMGTAHVARDGLGDRTLFYSLEPRRFLVASEEQALLAHPEISDRLDERRIAHYFAARVPADGSTFFTQIKELLPGEVLTVDEAGHRSGLCWQPRIDAGLSRLSDAECVDRYRALLTEAVSCRLRSSTVPVVLMSGGLDSTSIAAVGARELAAAGSTHRLRAVSWVFDELAACDERPFIDLVVDRCGLEAMTVRGDDAWPLCDRVLLGRNPGTPEQNPYRGLKQRAYLAAAAAGSRVVLSGASADVFSAGAVPWLQDLVRSGRLLEASRSIAIDIRKRGVADVLRRAGCGRLLHPLRARTGRRKVALPWLTEEARRCIESGHDLCASPVVFPRKDQSGVVLGAAEARSVSLEIFDATMAGVDLRHPYRDRRLTEFMLQIPAHQLYRNGRYKHLARAAASGHLPPEIPARVEPTQLTPLFRQGLFERERLTVERILASGVVVWPRFVSRRWVEDILRDGPRRPHDEIVLWQCLAFEAWMARRRGGAEARHSSARPVSLQESAA